MINDPTSKLLLLLLLLVRISLLPRQLVNKYRLEARSRILAQFQVPDEKCGVCFLIYAPRSPVWIQVLKVAQVEGMSKGRKAENTISKSTI